MERDDYDSAVFISALAGVYARYDQMRVTDESAHRAAAALRMKYLDSLAPDQQKKFVDVLRTRTNSPTKLTAMCDQIRGIGPPHYFPAYMIQHGMGAFVGNTPGDGLVAGFNGAHAWNEALTTLLNCPELTTG